MPSEARPADGRCALERHVTSSPARTALRLPHLIVDRVVDGHAALPSAYVSASVKVEWRETIFQPSSPRTHTSVSRKMPVRLCPLSSACCQ